LIKEAKDKSAAAKFLAYLQSANARKTFERSGFIVKF
jgi:ABC-type molybdate transport system substrate-binding protein